MPDLPKPRPYREIFVYGPRVEGTHLRFGAVARGGLRWSDVAKTSVPKCWAWSGTDGQNTVIVPVGAKGGFFDPPVNGDRDAIFANGVACYKLFIQGLLDITDNIVNNKIVPPVDVVPRHGRSVPGGGRRQGHCDVLRHRQRPGHRARLLDGDAFASGGSVGYDHKGMGITARGAWGVGQAPLPCAGP